MYCRTTFVLTFVQVILWSTWTYFTDKHDINGIKMIWEIEWKWLTLKWHIPHGSFSWYGQGKKSNCKKFFFWNEKKNGCRHFFRKTLHFCVIYIVAYLQFHGIYVLAIPCADGKKMFNIRIIQHKNDST